METLRKQMVDYFHTIRPDLSDTSKTLYAAQLEKIYEHSNMPIFDPIKLVKRVVNQSLLHKNLDMVLLRNGALQSQNQRLSAFRNLLEANEKDIAEIKYKKVYDMISSVGENLRESISLQAGLNIKTKNEQENMVSWNELTEFVENMVVENDVALRNKLILNLMINNHSKLGNTEFNVVLRVIEYSTLKLWTNKRKPPQDKHNYLWLLDGVGVLYIQHSKTTGGVKRQKGNIVPQIKLKTFTISQNIIDLLVKYMKVYKIKNKEDLFLDDSKLKPMDNSYFRNMIVKELKPLAKNITSSIIRKIYDNRPIEFENGNDKLQFAKLVDHSLQVAAVFYNKN